MADTARPIDVRELTPKTVQVSHLKEFPRMTSWFSPTLLAKLLLRVIVSDLFGQYADRRLIHAALDDASDKELLDRADLTAVMQRDSAGAVWIDFVADVGDGFDATYAIAHLLSHPQLTVGGHKLPRGSALVFGGDAVYPTASRDAYTINLRKPYSFAYPSTDDEPHPPALLIPGNHDWYDGLAHFLAFFCRSKPTPIGNWHTRQRRSYFAAKLTDTWWLWCIDIALVRDMDQPQADYFVTIAQNMASQSNIILCSAEPGWYEADREGDSYRTLSYAAWIAQNAPNDLRIPLILSGDTHHYARYSGAGAQFITSGGGGAFLHGTHSLKDKIKIDWLKDKDGELSLKTDPAGDHQPVETPACYPSKDVSRKLLKGNWKFSLLNPGFSVTLGLLYGLFGFSLSLRPHWDVALIEYLVLFAGLFAYTAYQAGGSVRVALISAGHAAVHMLAMLAICVVATKAAGCLYPLPQWHWLLYLAFHLALGGILGGAAAGTIFGLYLWLSCAGLHLNDNDAFSAMRLDTFRHFLRIRISGDTATVYPIGLDEVPARTDWVKNTDKSESPSVFKPKTPLAIRLIEGPIEISGRATPSTEEMKKPPELPPRA